MHKFSSKNGSEIEINDSKITFKISQKEWKEIGKKAQWDEDQQQSEPIGKDPWEIESKIQGLLSDLVYCGSSQWRAALKNIAQAIKIIQSRVDTPQNSQNKLSSSHRDCPFCGKHDVSESRCSDCGRVIPR